MLYNSLWEERRQRSFFSCQLIDESESAQVSMQKREDPREKGIIPDNDDFSENAITGLGDDESVDEVDVILHHSTRFLSNYTNARFMTGLKAS